MRGFPLINLLFVLVLLAGMATPLILLSVDADGKPAAPAESIKSDGSRPVSIKLRLAHPALEAGIYRDDKLVHAWKLPEDGLELNASVELPYVSKSMEIEVRLKWPEGTPETVAEVTLEPESLIGKSQNIWGSGETSEVLNFSWNESK